MVMTQQGLVKVFAWSLCGLVGVGSELGQGTVAAPANPPVLRSNVQPVLQGGGTVTGHVYCADTQRPARFADVELLRQSDVSSQTQNRGPMYQSVGRARTALDGSFAITGVQSGDYYVAATMTGYISPMAVSRMTQSPIAGVPFTHVEGDRSADVVISMTRGAVVTGHVAYDDGSAVPGVTVRLRPVASTSATAFGGPGGFGGGIFGGDLGFGQTDDRGVFRVVGLPVGSYNVVSTVETESTGKGQPGRGGFRGPAPTLSVYAPAAMRKSDARVVEIHGGETVEGADIQVALAGLHSVQGSVESKADGHMLNGGTVSIADAADASLTRTAGIDSDGTFRVEYLPAGNYTLTVRGEDRTLNGTQDNRSRQPASSVTRYQSATQAVTLGNSDITVDPVQLSAVQAASSATGTQ
jgi:hypothetical protein